jgi:hypothetical protein
MAITSTFLNEIKIYKMIWKAKKEEHILIKGFDLIRNNKGAPCVGVDC